MLKTYLQKLLRAFFKEQFITESIVELGAQVEGFIYTAPCNGYLVAWPVSSSDSKYPTFLALRKQVAGSDVSFSNFHFTPTASTGCAVNIYLTKGEQSYLSIGTDKQANLRFLKK